MAVSTRLPGTDAGRRGSSERLIHMSAAHQAFRRDLVRLRASAVPSHLRDPARRVSIMAGWNVFKHQLHIHHNAEDTFIWPKLRQRLATSDAAISILGEMDAEHEVIDPLLAAVDTAFDQPEVEDVAGVLDELIGSISFHLDHEEREAMPMIGEALSEQEWDEVSGAIRSVGMPSVAEYVPWLCDGFQDAAAERILSVLPPPVTIAFRQHWKPAYDSVNRW
jgi:iron-sulfur cluster repair protein YtfE (RIC family)